MGLSLGNQPLKNKNFGIREVVKVRILCKKR